jgi:predicted ATP-dependent protease
MEIPKIATEANYWAGKDGAERVTGAHVKSAIDQRQYRAGLTEDRLREMIEDGTIHIATQGEVVGRVNGLAVLSLGDYTFGKPSRITARVSWVAGSS